MAPAYGCRQDNALAKHNPRTVDLLKGPGQQALQIARDQVNIIVENLQPKQNRLRATTRWLHERGINLKDIMDV